MDVENEEAVTLVHDDVPTVDSGGGSGGNRAADSVGDCGARCSIISGDGTSVSHSGSEWPRRGCGGTGQLRLVSADSMYEEPSGAVGDGSGDSVGKDMA